MRAPHCITELNAPAVGENSEEVLRTAGDDESESQELRAASVIG